MSDVIPISSDAMSYRTLRPEDERRHPRLGVEPHDTRRDEPRAREPRQPHEVDVERSRG
jgi:hypothetical protein